MKKKFLLSFLIIFTTETFVLCNQIKLLNRNFNTIHQHNDGSDYWVESHHIEVILAYLQNLDPSMLATIFLSTRTGTLPDAIVMLCLENNITTEDATAIVICSIVYNQVTKTYYIKPPIKRSQSYSELHYRSPNWA